MFLTKSDFKVGRTCGTKLFYKKLHYPSLDDDDAYLAFLADGGFMIEKMARLLFQDGREIGHWDRPEQAFEETIQALQAGNVILFEPTVIHGKLLARIDILIREGKTLKLIEVKSTSIDTVADPHPFRGKQGSIVAGWRPYIEDVGFQAMVLQRAFPGFCVIPYLCVVDKAKTATSNVTFDKFKLRRGSQARSRPEVEYLGDVRQLSEDHLLTIIDVSAEVAELADEIKTAAEVLAATIEGDRIIRLPPAIGKKCKACEYRLPLGTELKNGFRECWGDLATPAPHILDLFMVHLAGGKTNDLVAELAAAGKARLDDVPRDRLDGKTAIRQRLQLDRTARNRESINPELKRILKKHPHPLYFIDFEASRLALPYHLGMRPYEQSAFQWSCHSVEKPSVRLTHSEWLNDRDAFPNFAFARSLMDQIGDDGTIYIWSPYERTVLREIRTQMDRYGEDDRHLADWIDRLTDEGNRRVVDLCDLAKRYYFHPSMAGSVSIKSVLPAVWGADPSLRADPEFAEYVGHDPKGQLLNPYTTLPSLPIGGQEEVVNEGTGAMRVYQESMYGLTASNPEAKENYRRLLLQYCRLDTAAMVVVWRHWTGSGK